MADEHTAATETHGESGQESGQSGAAAQSVTAEPPEPLFAKEELEQFEQEDIAAGRHITKMLALLFIYTVVAMSIVSWWTWNATQ